MSAFCSDLNVLNTFDRLLPEEILFHWGYVSTEEPVYILMNFIQVF